ncbi:MAG: hypothetical protein D8M58_13685 [Calditrichaeota bacterium]|nr:MAG: hypothetical protein DWQ03_14925 [Calditrichota bacterium]MBL1206451.1 hypothetical protein [Calditrichota bacterium]NOG46278.1 hypothetical protein [Calditrichota bacterium]
MKLLFQNNIVDADNAKDTLNLAKQSYSGAQDFIVKFKHKKYSTFEDKLFSIPTDKIGKIFSSMDFWEYFATASSKNKKLGFHEYGAKYYEEYFCKQKKFKSQNDSDV